MSERDLSHQEPQTEDREAEEEMHPLEAGIEAVMNGDTTSLEELFLD